MALSQAEGEALSVAGAQAFSEAQAAGEAKGQRLDAAELGFGSFKLRPYILFSVLVHLLAVFWIAQAAVWAKAGRELEVLSFYNVSLVNSGELEGAAGDGDEAAGQEADSPAEEAAEPAEPAPEEPTPEVAAPEEPPLPPVVEEIPPPEPLEAMALVPAPKPPALEKPKPKPPKPKAEKASPRPVKETKPAGSPNATGQSQGTGAKEAGTGPGTGAVGAGGGGGVKGYQDANYNYIKNRIRRFLVYNPQARRMGVEGTTTVAFTIAASGQAYDVAVNKSSGHEGLDNSAVTAVKAASPFPPPPSPARVVIPVVFSIR
jgi:protein TonB